MPLYYLARSVPSSRSCVHIATTQDHVVLRDRWRDKPQVAVTSADPCTWSNQNFDFTRA